MRGDSSHQYFLLEAASACSGRIQPRILACISCLFLRYLVTDDLRAICEKLLSVLPSGWTYEPQSGSCVGYV